MMSDEKVKGFHEKLDILGVQKEKVDEVINIKSENIKKDSVIVAILKRVRVKEHFVYEMFSNIPEENIIKMSPDEYVPLMGIIDDAIASGSLISPMEDDIRRSYTQSQEQLNICASMNTSYGTAASGAFHIGILNPTWFPNQMKIKDTYKMEDSLYEEIDNIRKKLDSLFPDIRNDFESFISKFLSSPVDETKYQELIGSRSMFYFKMIYETTEKKFGKQKSRRDSIERFVFGNSKPIAAVQPLIDRCFDLWKELSGQNANSVKKGNVSPNYIELLFRRLIGGMESILDLRSRYYKE